MTNLNDRCFVIQRFDGDKYDQRYEDVFAPAIRDAGLYPYRIDQDLSVNIPIEEIHVQIKNSRLCFAEISTDNPNVWYELGFAIASGKDVCLVCSDERNNKFPFDIQHRQIITYETKSLKDYTELGKKITEKLKLLSDKIKSESNEKSNYSISSKSNIKKHDMPNRVAGYSQKVEVGGHTLFLRTSEYENGELGGINIDMSKESASFRSLLGAYAQSVSMGLQFGIPLEKYIDDFLFYDFEPKGIVTGHEHIKMSSSILDFVFRELAFTYLGRTDVVHVKENEEGVKGLEA